MDKSIQHNYSADLIRALAIVLVIVVHVYSEFISKIIFVHSTDWWLAEFFESFAKISVPLFIMLSGFLLLDKKKSYTIGEFYKKRLFKIGIPILIWPVVFYF